MEAGGPADLPGLRATYQALLGQEEARACTADPVVAREGQHMAGVARQMLKMVDALEARRFDRAWVLARKALRRPPRAVTHGA